MRISAMALRGLAVLVVAAGCAAAAFIASARAAGPAEDTGNARRFVLANIEFSLLHEMAHILIWELKLPVFGREEDAADNIAVVSLLMMQDENNPGAVIDKLQSIADGWKLEWRLVEEEEIDHAYWDLHSLEIQRYYNIACLVYGADPKNREQIIHAAGLPTDRAEFCHEEYAMAKGAMDWLLSKHANTPQATPATTLAAVPVTQAGKRGQVHLVYEKNTSIDGETLDAWLQESKIPEKLVEIIETRFDLPRDITISFEQCPFPNASWDVDKASVQFCYSLMNRFMYLAREMARERLNAIDNAPWNADAAAAMLKK